MNFTMLVSPSFVKGTQVKNAAYSSISNMTLKEVALDFQSSDNAKALRTISTHKSRTNSGTNTF